MQRSEFLEHTVATYRQIDYWISKNASIGTKAKNGKGSGSVREFTAVDAKICDFLVSLSFLMGHYIPIHKGHEARQNMFELVSNQLQEVPTLLESEPGYLFVTFEGKIYDRLPGLMPGWTVPVDPSHILGSEK